MITRPPRSSVAWWRRLLVATAAAYLAGFVVEAVLGNWDPRRVGWSASYAPVLVEGFVFAFILRGVWGVVLAPLPLLLVPETWVRIDRVLAVAGPLGLAILIQPLPAMWVAGVAGAIFRRVMLWLADR